MNLGQIYTKKILVACLKFQLTGQFVFYRFLSNSPTRYMRMTLEAWEVALQ